MMISWFTIGLSGDRQKNESFPLEYMTVYVNPIGVAQVYTYTYVCILFGKKVIVLLIICVLRMSKI